MVWLPLPVETDPDAVALRVLEGLKDALPGWTPWEGALEVALAEELGRELAATNGRAADAAEAAIAGLGVSVDGLAAIIGAPAKLTTVLTLVPGGGVVPEGLTVLATMTSGAQVAYALPTAVSSVADTLQVVLVATTVGTSGNGLPATLEVVTATAVVVSATASDPATGGVDPETRDQYLTRLVAFRSLLRPGGVRAADLALLARNTPGVARALALDLYNAETDTDPAEKTVSLFPLTAGGRAVGAETTAALRADIERVREVGLVVAIGSPTFTPLAIEVAATAEPGADTGAVQAGIEAALAEHLSPATWGALPGDPGSWVPTPVVRYLEVVRAAGGAPGVLFLSSLTINATTADVTLPGRAALPAATDAPTPTTFTVVVSP